MKQKSWTRSACLCLAILAILAAGGFFLLSDGEAVPANKKVEAALNGSGGQLGYEPGGQEGESASADDSSPVVEEEARNQPAEDETGLASPQGETLSRDSESEQEKDREPAEEADDGDRESNSVQVAAAHKVEKKTESLQAESAEPAPQTQSVEEAARVEAEPVSNSTVSYSWGGARNFTFRIEVAVTNNGGGTSRNVRVSVPFLENSSPYQTTSLRSVNYSAASTSGRMRTFNIGDLAPGQTKTIVADFDITTRTVSINSTNETIEKARQAFNQYAGSGNCRTLARGFISKCREMGIQAREVVGFARPHHGPMTPGDLSGSRHSWAEFYVEGLGWVPVDLTFQYFGRLPHHSHVVECYSDQSIRVNYSGGSLSATWRNSIH